MKVEIEDRSADLAALAVRGADALDIQAQAFDAAQPIAAVRSRLGRTCPASSSLGDPPAIDGARGRASCEAGAVEIDADAYEALRVEAGVPRQGFDIDETTIPQEAFLERDAVSFTKGCFVGQELVCRIDTRGHVNRLLRRLRADAPLAARRGGGRRRQGGRHGHERGRRRRAGDRSAATVEPGGEVIGAHRPAATSPRASRRSTPDPDHENDASVVMLAAWVGRSTRRSGCRRPAARRRAAVPPIAAASSRTIARPRPVPTERPGVARAV